MNSLVEKALAFGFSHAVPLSMDTLVLRPEVRDMCAADKCRLFGRSWTCPPACGALEENIKTLERYSGGLLVQTTGELEDDFDYEGMDATGQMQQQRFYEFLKVLKSEFPGMAGLGSGGCRLCETCTYPDLPCRHPDDAVPSMEAFGIWVSDVCQKNNLDYYYGPKTITYTGCYLYPREE